MWIFLYFNLLLPLAFAEDTLTYSINTQWNGADIDHEPAVVELTNYEYESHYLVITVSAPFFNSPAYDITELEREECPKRSFKDLYNYEV